MASLNVPMYDPAMVRPMRERLSRVVYFQRHPAAEVDSALPDERAPMLVVVNSVCGCAARNARPAATLALEHPVRPTKLYTVFAGQDAEATDRARSYFTGYGPSSPSMALFRDGRLVYMLERRSIEGRSPRDIAADLVAAFDRFCA